MAATFQVRPGEPGCAEDALGQLARCHRAVKALVRLNAAGPPSHWRDCHFADATSPSLLKHLLKVEGGCSRMTELSPTARPAVPGRAGQVRPGRAELHRDGAGWPWAVHCRVYTTCHHHWYGRCFNQVSRGRRKSTAPPPRLGVALCRRPRGWAHRDARRQ